MKTKKILEAVYRNDLYSFVHKSFIEIDGSQKFIKSWHIELICDRLEKCLKGEIKRLIINIPPRNLKSHCTSICFPAYILGHNPKAKIICVSYSQSLANELSRKTRNLMESSFYKSVFKTRLGDKNTEDVFETTNNGCRFATSVGGTLTGLGGNFIIIDDPIKADDALSDKIREGINNWYDNTLVSRLNDKVNGVIILVMQRLHIDDLTGHLLKQDGWEILSLPAIAEEDENFKLSNGRIIGRKKGEVLNPVLEPLNILENQRKLMSNYNFSAQYQQNPIPPKGNIINYDDFEFFEIGEIAENATIFQSWDIALKDGINNDYSVCITAKYFNNILYITDINRYKLDMCPLVEKMHELYKLKNCNHLIIEESPVSTSILQYIQNINTLHPISYKPQSDKVMRANNIGLFVSSKRLLLLKNALWLEDFKAEINAFPFGRHDDQVDALSQLVEIATRFNSINLITIADAIRKRKEIDKIKTNENYCKMALKLYQRQSLLKRIPNFI